MCDTVTVHEALSYDPQVGVRNGILHDDIREVSHGAQIVPYERPTRSGCLCYLFAGYVLVMALRSHSNGSFQHLYPSIIGV